MNEFKKIFKSYKQIVVIILIALCGCLSLFFNSSFDNKEYKKFYNQIEDLDQKNVSLLIKNLEQKKEQYESMMNDNVGNSVEFKNFEKLFNQLEKEYQIAYGYNTWLQEQVTQHQTINQISIFQKKRNFQSSVSTKNYDAYKSLKVNITPKMQPSYGIEIWLNNNVIDLLLVLFSTYCIIFLYIQEEKTGFLNFVRIQFKGRKKIFLTKIITILILNFLMICILYGVTGIIIGIQYGLPSLLEPCQSIVLFKECPLSISVWQMLLLVFICKWLIINFFTVLLQFCASIFKNSILMISIFMVIQLIISVIANLIYEKTSIFYHIQFFQLLHPENNLNHVTCLNVFGYAIDYYWLLIMIFILISVFIYVENHMFKDYYTHSKTYSRLNKRNTLKSIQFYEMRKLIKSCYGGFLMIVVLMIVGSYIMSIKDVTYADDILYNHYIDYISNKVNKDTFLQIQKEKDYFEQLKDSLSNERDMSKILQINGELNFEIGLMRYEQHAQEIYISQKNINIIKEDQVRFVFEDNVINSFFVFFILTTITITCYLIKEKEKQSRMIYLQKISKENNLVIRLQKRYIFYLCTVLLLLLYSMLLIKNMIMYNNQWLVFRTLEYSLLSLFPINIPIYVYIIIQILYQILLIYLIIQLFYYLYQKIFNTRFLLLLSLFIFGIFTFPLSEVMSNFGVFKTLFFPHQSLLIYLSIVICIFTITIIIKRIVIRRKEI